MVMNMRYTKAVLIILLAGCSASHTAGPTTVLPGAPSLSRTNVIQTSGIWTSKPAMPTARAALAVGDFNGILYAVGGYNTDFLTTVEAYDPATNAWTAKASMPTKRPSLAAGVVNGILYAIGGLGGFGPPPPATLNTVEAYDPTTNTWTAKASMPTARLGLAVCVVHNILYAVGGEDANRVILNTVDAYDPTTNTWTTKAAMPTPRYGLTA